jgi:hypothetical protein
MLCGLPTSSSTPTAALPPRPYSHQPYTPQQGSSGSLIVAMLIIVGLAYLVYYLLLAV